MMEVTASIYYDCEPTTREKLLMNARNIEETKEQLARYEDLTAELKRLEDEEVDLLKKLLAERSAGVR